jgi:hypothetical protein
VDADAARREGTDHRTRVEATTEEGEGRGVAARAQRDCLHEALVGLSGQLSHGPRRGGDVVPAPVLRPPCLGAPEAHHLGGAQLRDVRVGRPRPERGPERDHLGHGAHIHPLRHHVELLEDAQGSGEDDQIFVGPVVERADAELVGDEAQLSGQRLVVGRAEDSPRARERSQVAFEPAFVQQIKFGLAPVARAPSQERLAGH